MCRSRSPWSFLIALLLFSGSRTLAAQRDCPSCIDYSVAVSVIGSDQLGEPRNGSGLTAVFKVENTGNLGDDYTFTCTSTGGVTCGIVSPTMATLQSGDTLHVQVSFSTGTTLGTLRLRATGQEGGATALTLYNISYAPVITLVVPAASGGRAVVRNRQPAIRATYLGDGSPLDTTQTALRWRGETVTTLARANRGLIEWDVDSTRWLGVGDSAKTIVKACSQAGACDSLSTWVVLPNDNKPVIGFTSVPLEALGRQFSAPFGPGLAVSGAEIETGLATPPYVSMGMARSAGLVYSTRQSYPRALIPVDVEWPWPAGAPDQIKVAIWDGAVRMDSVAIATPSCTTGGIRRCRLVLQADFSSGSYATPTRKWIRAEVTVSSGGSANMASDSVEVVLVDRRSTVYGSGWWPAGILKLVAAGSDRVLIGPTGATAIYRGNGDSLYLSPPGDFSVLTKVTGGWELSPRGSLAKIVFDSNGRLVRSVDANGNKDSVVYNGTSDQVTSLRDPVGKVITFGYDANGKLSTFTDPGSRQTRVTINNSTNQLTYDSLPSSTSRPYTSTLVYQTYSGTNTVVLTKRIGVIADTTVVTYDSTFRRRPSQVTLPSVQDENGSSVRPVVTYTAMERQGVGAFRTLDSIYVELKDPRNNWTRSLLNRWGQARRTWDVIGLLGRVEYTGEGFVLWSEGKNGDSSRVYSRYDALRRLVRTYIVRSSSDTLKLDSLVYDSNHRVISRIDARGQRDSVVYDSKGNVLRTITPHNDTTKFWYQSNGLLDSTRAPGSSTSRGFRYDATWKNGLRIIDESGFTIDSILVDVLGRDSVHMSKVRVQKNQNTYQWQWRRVQTFFSASGQVDSTRLTRSDNCSPCDTPPTWVAASDTIRTQRVAYLFDRAGRDSLRLNDRQATAGAPYKGTQYLYDRLGRLIIRRPWSDSAAVRDSMAYDVAGNLKKTSTRRGDVIVSNFDSRNRDTLTSIPGVGDLRRAFGGALDQLTRLWFDNLVDSIGGVNPALAWVYDQRGRLKSDTSFTNTTVRGTAYTYDAFERPGTTTDAVGTWTLRYDSIRGYADTLLTPFGDTITYSFDAQDRALGPTVRAGGDPLSRLPAWKVTGLLSELTNSIGGTSNYTAGAWLSRLLGNEAHPSLGPAWVQQYGSAGALDTLQDSLVLDGWERLVHWTGFRNGSSVSSETYSFDRLGNIQTTGGAEVYDLVTGRLTSRTDGGGTWSYTYDRAGNLVKAVQGSDTLVYGYDAVNRLRSFRKNGTLIARYAYDVSGRRIAKRVYSSSTGGTVAYMRFVYRGANVGFEADSAGAIDLRYVWGPAADDLLAIRDSVGASSVTYNVVQDRLRSVRGLVKRDGTWMMARRFGPYGAITMDTASATLPFELRYRWTAREYDSETGWYYFRARYYQPIARRFVQEDPIGDDGDENIYAYAGGNPVDRRDPGGTSWMDEVKVNWHDLYMWNNCWSDRCDGNAWRRGEAWKGFGWNILTSFERQSIYDQYIRYYAKAKGELVKRSLENSERIRADLLARFSNPLNTNQFGNTIDALGVLHASMNPVMMNPVASTMGRLLAGGRIFVNTELNLQQGSYALSNAKREYIILSGSVASSSEFLTFILAHEYAHWITGDPREGRANRIACAFFNYSAVCP